MESVSTQLAVPGQYAPLARNVIAPKLKKQLHGDAKIVHARPHVLKYHKIFRDNEYTSKIGGLPCWLPPSPEGDEEGGDNIPPEQLLAQMDEKPTIPTCPGCEQKMFLITQLFSPVDFFPEDVFPAMANKPILSCYTSRLIKKHAAMQNIMSSSPNTVLNVSRHGRALYVFACARAQCSQNPGAWKTVSIIQSAPKSIPYDALGRALTKDQARKMLARQQAKEQANIALYGADDDLEDDDEDMEQEEDEDDDEDYEDEDNEEEEENNNTPEVPQPTPEPTVVEIKAPSTISNTLKLTTSAKTDNTTGMFDMGGWSSDEEEEQQTPTQPEVDMATLQKMVAETQQMQQKLIDSNKGGKMKTDKDYKEMMSKKKRKPLKKLPPIYLEDNNNNDDGESVDFVKLSEDEILFFKPFYVWWEEDKQREIKHDYSTENKLLDEYLANGGDEGEESDAAAATASGKKKDNNNNDGDDDDNDNGNNNNDEEEDGDEDDEDPFEIYNSVTAFQPDQIIRYYNSDLTLHRAPTDQNLLAKFKKNAEKHPLYQYTNQSGLWLLNDVPNCECCGEPLTLECQILPTMLFELQPDEFEQHNLHQILSGVKNELNQEQDEIIKRKKQVIDKHTIGLDFGIVNIYTCLNPCNPDSYNTGFCLVQPAL